MATAFAGPLRYMKWTFGHTGADMTSLIEMTSGTTAMKQMETCKR